jgi:large subunit ribosomal protein L30
VTKLKIRQTRSTSGTKPNQRATLRALGLGRPGASAERADSPQLRGQLRVVKHLVKVDDEEGG